MAFQENSNNIEINFIGMFFLLYRQPNDQISDNLDIVNDASNIIS